MNISLAKVLRCSVVTLAALSIVACSSSDDSEPNPNGGNNGDNNGNNNNGNGNGDGNGPPNTPAPAADLDSQDWIIDTLALGGAMDGFDQTGDGVPDNAAAQLLTNPLVVNAVGDVNMLIQEALNDGSIMLMLDSVGWGDYGTDDHASVNLFLGEEPEDPQACIDAKVADGTEADVAEEECQAEAAADNFSGNASFNIDCDSIENGMPLVALNNGQVTDGKFTAGPARFVLDIPFEDLMIRLIIDRTLVEGTVAADGSGMSNGLIGGAIPTEELSTAIMMIPDAAQYADVIMNLLPNIADVDLDGDEEPDAISISLLFTATGASINGTFADCP